MIDNSTREKLDAGEMVFGCVLRQAEPWRGMLDYLKQSREL